MHEESVFVKNPEEDTAIYRRLRIAGGREARSLCITLPKKFLVAIGVKHGDFLKITTKGSRMVIEKPTT